MALFGKHWFEDEEGHKPDPGPLSHWAEDFCYGSTDKDPFIGPAIDLYNAIPITTPKKSKVSK
jgi:hypothetical protein